MRQSMSSFIKHLVNCLQLWCRVLDLAVFRDIWLWLKSTTRNREREREREGGGGERERGWVCVCVRARAGEREKREFIVAGASFVIRMRITV